MNWSAWSRCRVHKLGPTPTRCKPTGAGRRRAGGVLTVGDAQAVLELGLDAQLVQPGVDLRAAAMHHHRLNAHARQQNEVGHNTCLLGSGGGCSV